MWKVRMALKIHSRSVATNNTLLFLIASVTNLFILRSIGGGTSAVSIEAFKMFLTDHIVLLSFFIITFMMIFLAKRFSKIMILIFFGIVSSYNLATYFIIFDKIILLFSFIHLIASIYFFVLWHQELEIVVYWPGFYTNDIGPKNSYDIPVTVTSKKLGTEMSAVLTNWGEFECFILMKDGEDLPRGKVIMNISYENCNFSQEGRVVTSYGGGVGIKLEGVNKNEFSGDGWRDFFTIISHRGYSPRYVRV